MLFANEWRDHALYVRKLARGIIDPRIFEAAEFYAAECEAAATRAEFNPNSNQSSCTSD